MRVTITTDLNPNSRVPQWLSDAVNHAERTGAKVTITTGHPRPKKAVKQ